MMQEEHTVGTIIRAVYVRMYVMNVLGVDVSVKHSCIYFTSMPSNAFYRLHEHSWFMYINMKENWNYI